MLRIANSYFSFRISCNNDCTKSFGEIFKEQHSNAKQFTDDNKRESEEASTT